MWLSNLARAETCSPHLVIASPAIDMRFYTNNLRASGILGEVENSDSTDVLNLHSPRSHEPEGS